MDGVGDPWVTFSGFIEVFRQFGLKTGHYRKPTGCTRNLQDSLYFYKIQPGEKQEVLEVMEGLGKVVDGWNGVRKCLGSLKSQHQG